MLNVKSVTEVIQIIDNHFGKPLKDNVEEINILNSLSRVVAEDILCNEDIPGFDRSTVDGYGLMAKDTFGCSESIPALLDLVGSVEMGAGFDRVIAPNQCAYIPTGGVLPRGVDSVAMIEYSEIFDDQTIGITKPCAPGENIICKGEDVKQGAVIIKKGSRIRPQDIGALAASGISKVKVYKKVKVSIISTGNEIQDIDAQLELGKVRDINGYAVAAAVMRDGGEVIFIDRVRDDKELIEATIKKAMDASDIVFISGGSSVGVKDMTSEILEQLGSPGILVHGVSVKPGKPTIVADIKGKAVIGLPGHPVSALVIYNIIGSEVVKNLSGVHRHKPAYYIGQFEKNYPKAAGREEYVMVELEQRDETNYVRPIYSKSGLITTMTKAVGYVKVDVNKEGIKQGETVEVIPF